MVVAIYQSEFQHQELDRPPYTRSHSMRPTGQRVEEPINVSEIAQHLSYLRQSNPSQFERLTSGTSDVVHLQHVRTVRDLDHSATIDALLIGSESDPASEADTMPIVELFEAVLGRELGGRIGKAKQHSLDFADATRSSSAKEVAERAAFAQSFEELVARIGAESVPWDACYVSVRGPVARRLEAAIGFALPAALPIWTIDRRSDSEEPQIEPMDRSLAGESRLVRDLLGAWSRAERLDALRVADLVVEEARLLRARRPSIPGGSDLDQLLGADDVSE